jgi:hypothetical protein
MTIVIGREGKSSACAGSAQAKVAAASAAITLNFMVERPWVVFFAQKGSDGRHIDVTARQSCIACGIRSTRPFAATPFVG